MSLECWCYFDDLLGIALEEWWKNKISIEPYWYLQIVSDNLVELLLMDMKEDGFL